VLNPDNETEIETKLKLRYS